MSNTIHIELPGIEAKLDRIIELLEKQTTDTPAASAEEPKPEPAEPVTPAEETPAQTAEPPAAPTVTVAEVQQKVVALSAAGKKDAVREIVNTYAARVSLIPEDKLAEVMAKLTALEV